MGTESNLPDRDQLMQRMGEHFEPRRDVYDALGDDEAAKARVFSGTESNDSVSERIAAARPADEVFAQIHERGPEWVPESPLPATGERCDECGYIVCPHRTAKLVAERDALRAVVDAVGALMAAWDECESETCRGCRICDPAEQDLQGAWEAYRGQ